MKKLLLLMGAGLLLTACSASQDTSEIENLQDQVSQLQDENEGYRDRIESLEETNKDLNDSLSDARYELSEAPDISQDDYDQLQSENQELSDALSEAATAAIHERSGRETLEAAYQQGWDYVEWDYSSVSDSQLATWSNGTP
jgi:predicted RNase H-like nuclease (RuvC/YqgF family)